MLNKLKTIAPLFILIVLLQAIPASCDPPPKVIHTFVALCDNELQGVIPVPALIGNGMDARNNLYWGAMYGVKTFFKKSENWELLTTIKDPDDLILERCVFKFKGKDVYLVADAYKGLAIKDAIVDFLDSASGNKTGTVNVKSGSGTISLKIAGRSDLLAYVGHDGLMEFDVAKPKKTQNDKKREVIILACASKKYFNSLIKRTGAYPLLWTTNLMAPEAYVLKSAVEGWIEGESGEKIKERAAVSYQKYQKCSLKGARNLFATGF